MLWIPLIAAVTCLVSLWLLKRHAPRLGLMDEPGVRKVHKTPVPRIGGIAILLGWVAALAVWQWANPSSWAWLQELVASPVQAAEKGIEANPELTGAAQVALLPTGIGYTGLTLLLAVLAMGLLGLIDDRFNLRARHKLGAQLIVATALCASGLRLETIQFTQGAALDLGDFSWPITILWLVGVTNAINLIDGLDGLAGGIAVLTIAVLAYIGWDSGNQDLLMLSLGILGGLVVFVCNNWHPAGAYLGDAGSLSLGMFCAGGTLLALQANTRYDNLLLPGIAMSVALGDMVISVLRRMLERRSPFAPDRGHIHHVLLGLGLRAPRAALVLNLSAALGVVVAVLGRNENAILRAGALLTGCGIVMGLFWGVGYFRIRSTMRAWRESVIESRSQREEQREFEHATLLTRETTDGAVFWGQIAELAESWGFESLLILTANLQPISDNSSKTDDNAMLVDEVGDKVLLSWYGDTDSSRWRRSTSLEGMIDTKLGKSYIIKVSFPRGALPVSKSTRRFSLLARLLEENWPGVNVTSSSKEPECDVGLLPRPAFESDLVAG
jgi:UDP-GlcNAc:undecaprenyl-phosphate GlcNAc-1-phosphate transferase